MEQKTDPIMLLPADLLQPQWDNQLGVYSHLESCNARETTIYEVSTRETSHAYPQLEDEDIRVLI